MSKQNGYDSRTLDQEPDATAIIPSDPNFIIIGTYSLIENDDEDRISSRKGSLQILPFSKGIGGHPSEPPSLPRLDFSFGIYDIQFHPQYPDLLGVATSDAQVLFFSVRHGLDNDGCHPKFSFIGLGQVLVEERSESQRQQAIITQLRFISISAQLDDGNAQSLLSRDSRMILLAATTQFGNTKLIKAALSSPGPTSIYLHGVQDNENSDLLESIHSQVIGVHKQAFDLEAWAILPIMFRSPLPASQGLLILSGGDDARLLISHLSLSPLELSEIDLGSVDVNLLVTLRKEHQSGIVAFCNLGLLGSEKLPQSSVESGSMRKWLILTGSYDEHIRLFLLTINDIGQESATNPPTCSLKLLSEFNLGGGVWRIKKLDSYTTPVGISSTSSPSTHTKAVEMKTEYILLIAGHTSGAHIVRLTVTMVESFETDLKYEFKVEESFTEGHESLVYAVEARRGQTSIGLGGDISSETQKWEIGCNQDSAMDKTELQKDCTDSRDCVTNDLVVRPYASFQNQLLQKIVRDHENPFGKELNLKDLIEDYGNSSQRLLIFDYDGTLTPLVDDPESAVPSNTTLEGLTRLSSDSTAEVWLISGRSRWFLERHFGHIKTLGLCAEHGCFTKEPGEEEWKLLASARDVGWKALIDPIFAQLTTEIAGSEVERKEVAMVWHYRNADRVLGSQKAEQTQITLAKSLSAWDLDVVLGSNILEVRPKSINKGTIVSALVEKIFETEQGFIFCAGDDTTDEDMFQVLLNAKQLHVYTCLVSTTAKTSLARYRVSTPADIEYVLENLP